MSAPEIVKTDGDRGSGCEPAASQQAAHNTGTTNEVSLPCIESERILNALDQLLVRLRTVLLLPQVWGAVVENCGHHVPEPLAEAVETYLRLRVQFHRDAEQVRASVPPASSSHSLETFDVTDTGGGGGAAERAVPEAPSDGLIGTPGADERCVAVLTATIEQLAAATRHLVRQWRHHAGPARLDGQLSGQCAPPAHQFLQQMAHLRRQMYLRLVTTPDQEASRTERLREIWRRDNHNQLVLSDLRARQDSLLQQRDSDRQMKTAIINQLEAEITDVERKSAEDLANVIFGRRPWIRNRPSMRVNPHDERFHYKRSPGRARSKSSGSSSNEAEIRVREDTSDSGAEKSRGEGRVEGRGDQPRQVFSRVWSKTAGWVDKDAEAESDIMSQRAAYRVEKDRLRKIYERSSAGLQQLRISNRQAESALKKRKYKIESELENWLQKYDSEMMEKTEEIETLQAEFEKETAEREEYDANVEAIRDRYDSIILKRERLEELRIFEEQFAIKKAAAAVYIQAFWRGYRVRKRFRKGKKGKGKKGKKGSGGKKGGKDKGSPKTKSPKGSPKRKKGKK